MCEGPSGINACHHRDPDHLPSSHLQRAHPLVEGRPRCHHVIHEPSRRTRDNRWLCTHCVTDVLASQRRRQPGLVLNASTPLKYRLHWYVDHGARGSGQPSGMIVSARPGRSPGRGNRNENPTRVTTTVVGQNRGGSEQPAERECQR